MKNIQIDHRIKTIPSIVLNRPERGNALSIELMEELLKVLQEFSTSDKVRAIILTGAGKHFCSGLDLKEATSDEMIERSSSMLRDLYLALAYFPKPVVASLRGHTLAGGIGLAMLSDLVISSKDGKIQFPEVHRGLVPAYLLSVLKQRFPDGLLRAMALFAYPLTAAEAFNFGMIHFLVDEEEREKKLDEIASWVCKGAPGAQFHTKNLLGALLEPRFKEDLLYSEGLHRKARESDEAREGIAAFFEKRCPTWCQE